MDVDVRPGAGPLLRLRVLLAAVAAAFLVLLPASTADADGGLLDQTARITNDQVAWTIGNDGILHGTETIDYAFAAGKRSHGIVRYYPVRLKYQDRTDVYRFMDLDIESVTSPTGAPTTYELTDRGPSKLLQIGDKNRYVSGTQTYVITYSVRGVVNDFADHQELYLNAVGTGWTVPIEKAEVSITAPVASSKVVCTQGPYGSKTPCASASAGATSRFTATGLGPGNGMTVGATYPAKTFANAEPILVNGDPNDGGGIGETMSPATAKTFSGAAYGLGALVPAVVATLMFLAHRRTGRDEQYAGITPGLRPGTGDPSTYASAPTERITKTPITVQFHPPEGVRPGMVGTLIDESADTIDVSATVVDLAVRGFLRIEEPPEQERGRRADWILTELAPPPGETLTGYEQTVYEGLFQHGSPIRLSELKHTFAGYLKSTQRQMYDEAVARGWFRRSPETTRQAWRALGLLLLVVGLVVGFVVTAATSSIDRAAGLGFGVPSGLVLGAGMALAGAVIMAFAPRMPARLPEGSAVNAQAMGFRQYLATAEANQIRFEEAQSIFSRYLPYAIVFGVADHWAKVFKEVAQAADLAGTPIDMPTWFFFYGGGWGDGGFGGGFDDIAASMDEFSTMAAGTFTATPGASGESAFGGGDSGGGFFGGGGGDFGGFSGGGDFGGGGGGDW